MLLFVANAGSAAAAACRDVTAVEVVPVMGQVTRDVPITRSVQTGMADQLIPAGVQYQAQEYQLVDVPGYVVSGGHVESQWAQTGSESYSYTYSYEAWATGSRTVTGSRVVDRGGWYTVRPGANVPIWGMCTSNCPAGRPGTQILGYWWDPPLVVWQSNMVTEYYSYEEYYSYPYTATATAWATRPVYGWVDVWVAEYAWVPNATQQWQWVDVTRTSDGTATVRVPVYEDVTTIEQVTTTEQVGTTSESVTRSVCRLYPS
jgi:hypothetical protein